MFGMEGVELEVREAALKSVARQALERKTGARGLRSILEHTLLNTMFDLPSLENVIKVVVDENTIVERCAAAADLRRPAQGRGRLRALTQSRRRAGRRIRRDSPGRKAGASGTDLASPGFELAREADIAAHLEYPGFSPTLR